jgi:peroxiredoxin
LRDAVEDVAGLGAALAAVGTGDLAYARDFAEERDIRFPLLVDETSASYRAVGTLKASKRQLLNPRLAVASAATVARGHVQGKPGRAPMVLGAAHVIRPDGTVAYAWVNDDFDDNAPVGDLLQAVSAG